jgi:hypothetical protein
MTSPVPKNKKLYNNIVKKAKKKFSAWPSAYASGWVVKEYKRQGGKYIGSKPSKNSGLQRWFEEKWINVCKLPKKVPCGRPNSKLSDWKKKYPYCRPSIKINKSTPIIASKLTTKQINSRCKQKKTNPSQRITRRKSRKPSKVRKQSRRKSRKSSKVRKQSRKKSRKPSKARKQSRKKSRKPSKVRKQSSKKSHKPSKVKKQSRRKSRKPSKVRK